MSGPEIAQELVISLSAVRTQTKSIFSKLNVNSRRTVMKRTIELGLIKMLKWIMYFITPRQISLAGF
ncbi:MAG: response regulator transcription factor [Chloroflexi bacterium]|nr:response regulator transcription factor [Chloroflexota bacterium]